MSQFFFTQNHILFKDTFLITELRKKKQKSLSTYISGFSCVLRQKKYIDKLEMIFIFGNQTTLSFF